MKMMVLTAVFALMAPPAKTVKHGKVYDNYNAILLLLHSVPHAVL